MISVVCWLWRIGFRDYRPAHVNLLQRMVARWYPEPHRFICITDEPADLFASAVTVVPTPPAALALSHHRNPSGAMFPACYRRLWTFSEDAKQLGERLLLLDIDMVILRDLGPLLAVADDFVGYHPPRTDERAPERWAGGMYLLRAGSRRQVWDDFNGQESIQRARRAGYHGSDQAWISFRLGPGEVAWGPEAGIHSVLDFKPSQLPEGARVVQFNGGLKPWNARLTWVTDAYAEAASSEISQAGDGLTPPG